MIFFFHFAAHLEPLTSSQRVGTHIQKSAKKKKKFFLPTFIARFVSGEIFASEKHTFKSFASRSTASPTWLTAPSEWQSCHLSKELMEEEKVSPQQITIGRMMNAAAAQAASITPSYSFSLQTTGPFSRGRWCIAEHLRRQFAEGL